MAQTLKDRGYTIVFPLGSFPELLVDLDSRQDPHFAQMIVSEVEKARSLPETILEQIVEGREPTGSIKAELLQYSSEDNMNNNYYADLDETVKRLVKFGPMNEKGEIDEKYDPGFLEVYMIRTTEQIEKTISFHLGTERTVNADVLEEVQVYLETGKESKRYKIRLVNPQEHNEHNLNPPAQDVYSSHRYVAIELDTPGGQSPIYLPVIINERVVPRTKEDLIKKRKAAKKKA